MAVDKLVDSSQLDSDLTSVANAIRAKSGGSSQLAFPAGFVSEIGNIPSGGGLPVFSEVDGGVLQVASRNKKLTISTTLTQAPDFAVVVCLNTWAKSFNAATGKYVIYQQDFVLQRGTKRSVVLFGNDSINNTGGYSFSNGKITFSNIMGLAPAFSPTQIIDSEGTTENISYMWFAGKYASEV